MLERSRVMPVLVDTSLLVQYTTPQPIAVVRELVEICACL